MSTTTSARAASSIAATRLVNKVLQMRKDLAGTLLKAVRSINKINMSQESDLGEGLHSAHCEPYFYECSYVYYNSDTPITISADEHGQSKFLSLKCTKVYSRSPDTRK